MVNKRLLKSAIVAAGYTQRDLAKEIGISNSSMTRKIKNGSFGTDEAMRIISVLNISDPAKIFFAEKIT